MQATSTQFYSNYTPWYNASFYCINYIGVEMLNTALASSYAKHEAIVSLCCFGHHYVNLKEIPKVIR